MTQIFKHLADRLHRQYASVVGRPMPWRMIDALVTLEEKLEERKYLPKRAPVSASKNDPAVDKPS